MSYEETPSVGFVEAVKLYFANATNFRTRSRRSEYWKAVLFLLLVNILGTMVLGVLGGLLGDAGSLISGLITLGWSGFTFLASLAMCVRRLHDVGKSGWCYLLGLLPIGNIVVFVWCCMDSTEANQWGPNPKNPSEVRAAASANVIDLSDYAPQTPAANVYVPETPAYAPQTPAYNSEATVYEPQNPQLADPAPQAEVTLYLYTGPMAGTSFRNSVGRTVTLGRNPSKCDIVLSQYEVVSGAHCQIGFFEDYITVADLNSTNGTYVNGVRLTPNTPVSARNGATVYLANSTCAFQVRFQ